jgi:hypothetical protein
MGWNHPLIRFFQQHPRHIGTKWCTRCSHSDPCCVVLPAAVTDLISPQYRPVLGSERFIRIFAWSLTIASPDVLLTAVSCRPSTGCKRYVLDNAKNLHKELLAYTY